MNIYPFDGTEDEYCVKCKHRNPVDSKKCEKCGSEVFIFGWGIKPIHEGKEGFSCQCGTSLNFGKQIGHINADPIHESLYICDNCKRIFGTQINVKPKEDVK